MTDRVAPPKNTGGGGFVFEDDVCAWMLACMLVSEPVFDVELGAPLRLDFQTRPDGWFLDDVLVTTAVGAVHHRFSASIKSNPQFTASTAPHDFVLCIWEQWLHVGSAMFDPARDFMVLVSAPLSGAAADSVSGLIEKARVEDPNLFPSRLATSGWATEDERNLFTSFACPASLSAAPTDIDTARLLQRLRFLQRDFGIVTSESLKIALDLCRRAVSSHLDDDAQALWNFLRGCAAELRPRAGSITLQGLVDRLRDRVALADYPHHAGDWVALDARSYRDATMVPDAVGGRIRIPRDAKIEELADAVAANQLVALLGPSGVGKSALSRAILERRRSRSERTLWLDARSLDCADFGTFESALHLKYPLAELLSAAPDQDPLLVLDGLDRLFSDQAFRNAATIVRLARQEAPATRWRIVASCQSQEWPRVLEALQRNGAAPGQWTLLQLEATKPADIRPVGEAVPALKRLLLQPKVVSLLTNLKLLDLVVRRVDEGGNIDPARWVGESSVAEWFWTAEIERGADRFARGRVARALAQRQADHLVTSVPIDDFEGGDLGPLESLAADQLCVKDTSDHIAFAHDLYGDWARLRILLNHRGDLLGFIRGRHESPLWHRALRLLGVYLLEHAGGVADWKTVLSLFDNNEMRVVYDVLLEAPVFAVNARDLLDAVFPDLVAGDGVLLRRLLTRFLAFATVPNAGMVALARSLGTAAYTARATYRVPYWPYWPDVLAVLHARQDAALSAAPAEVARITEMWLDFAQEGAIGRAEAAELGVLLGQHALNTRGAYGDRDWERERERFYRCALLAAQERPDAVAHLALTAAERVSRPTSPENRASVPRPRRSGLFGGTGIMLGPWPDGPFASVDEAFQNVVLEGAAIRRLYRVRPGVAREVLLAALINEPREDDWNDDWMFQRHLDLINRREWFPALYLHGPFLMCLQDNFAEGLELVVRLIEFAAERHDQYSSRRFRNNRAREVARGQADADVNKSPDSAVPKGISLLDGDRVLTFYGDERVYGWSAGLGNPPDAVESALMALEQYFYQRLDEGKEVANEASAVLARSRCVALLGVLCDVGKRQETLFEGALSALLTAPEIYAWEIPKIVNDRSHLMIGAFERGELFTRLAQKFHALEHRKRDLRYVATELMLNRVTMGEFFARAREWWRTRESAGERLPDLTQQLIILLDPANYELREDAQQRVIAVNVEAERLDAARAGERQAMNDQLLIITFPTWCRRILDEKQKQNDNQLQELWLSWVRIRGLAEAGPELPRGEERFGDEYANAIAGGVAVFLWHDEWCNAEPSRRTEVEAALLSILDDPPERSGFDTDDSVSNWTWESFLAEAGAMLWTRDQNSRRWRRLVGETVFCQKYAALRALFARCAEHRAMLGEDFGRLRRLALEWAYARFRVEMLRRAPREALQLKDKVRERIEKELAAWAKEKLAAFVNGSSNGMPSDWRDCDDPDRFKKLDTVSRKWMRSSGMDFQVVRCSNEWLPLPDSTLDPAEREEVIRFWRAALRVIITRPLADLNRRDHQYPDDDEQWVLENSAAAVLQLRPDEKPELLWLPVIDLYGEAHDWPEVFAHSLHQHALRASTTPTNYTTLVRSMVQRAFIDVAGKRRWPGHERVWEALVGIDWYSRDWWEERHAGTVRDLSDVFSLWMEKVPLDGQLLRDLAKWLCRPAAVPIRLNTLPWILGCVRIDKEQALRHVEDAEDAIADLLNVVWGKDEQSLRAAPEAFRAFRGLLAWLGDRQNALGLELLGRIGSLG